MESSDVLRTLRLQSGGGTVRLERLLPGSPGAIWPACTEPDRLRRWIGDVRGDPVVGATVTLAMGSTDTVTCRIDTCRAPDLLVCGWTWPDGPDSLVRLELHPRGAATLLVLEHSGLPVSSTAGYGAGWEDFLRALVEHLGNPAADVAEVSWAEIETALLPPWKVLARRAEQAGPEADSALDAATRP